MLDNASRSLTPSALGEALINGYMRIDSALVMPKVRHDIESACMEVRRGKATKEAVLHDSLNMFQRKFLNFKDKISLIDEIFDGIFQPIKEVSKKLVKCGTCSKFMSLVDGRTPFLLCSGCNKE